jgi:hypothetical protein
MEIQKTAPLGRGISSPRKAVSLRNLALARLKAAIGLVDHIDPPLAADNPAIAVAIFRRL